MYPEAILIHTFEFAKIAPKLYEGKVVWDARAKECVTWKAGATDKAFVSSARAPSNMKPVKWVTVEYVQIGIRSRCHYAYVLLTSFCKLSTLPGLDKPRLDRHREKRS